MGTARLPAHGLGLFPGPDMASTGTARNPIPWRWQETTSPGARGTQGWLVAGQHCPKSNPRLGAAHPRGKAEAPGRDADFLALKGMQRRGQRQGGKGRGPGWKHCLKPDIPGIKSLSPSTSSEALLTDLTSLRGNFSSWEIGDKEKCVPHGGAERTITHQVLLRRPA